MKTVAIVGVGLIGGSFALALRKAGFTGRIVGVSSPRTVEEALRLGVIDEARPLEAAAADADLVYLSQPIARILETIERLDVSLKPGCLVTDAGSTKRAIVERARGHIRRGLFLGGHPMAGKESRGVAAAEAELFAGRPYVFTPLEAGDMEAAPVREFRVWVEKTGARPIVLDAGEHDRLVAFVSHLPQLLSTALASTLAAEAERRPVEKVSGPGLLDMTRLALSPWEIWEDIIATNRDYIAEALDAYVEKLKTIRSSLAWPAIRDEFASANALAAKLRGGRPG